MLSVGTIRYEDRFCASRMGGTRGGGGCHPEADGAWRPVVVCYRKALVNARWGIVQHFCANRPRKHSFRLVVWRSTLWSEDLDYIY